MERGVTGDVNLRSRGLSYKWNQSILVHDSLRMKPLLDVVSLNDLQQHFVIEKKVQPQMAGAHARPSVDVLYRHHQPRPGRILL